MIKETYDVAILLGGSVNDDGSLGSNQKAQVEAAAELYASGGAANILTCGAYSYKREVRPLLTEARAYAKYLEELGVAKVYTEERSLETVSSLYFAKKLALTKGWRHILIIPAINHSSERVEYLARKIFGSHCQWSILRAKENTSVENIKREQKSLRLTKEINSHVPDGDHETIYRLLCETHPAYGGTKFTLEELRELMGPVNNFKQRANSVH